PANRSAGNSCSASRMLTPTTVPSPTSVRKMPSAMEMTRTGGSSDATIRDVAVIPRRPISGSDTVTIAVPLDPRPRNPRASSAGSLVSRGWLRVPPPKTMPPPLRFRSRSLVVCLFSGTAVEILQYGAGILHDQFERLVLLDRAGARRTIANDDIEVL